MFAFRLAKDLGLPVGVMLRSMSSGEFSEWIAFYLVEAEETKKAQLEAEAQSKLNARRR